jgi:isocitrate/isopropylmalate dehydrogenase
MIENSKTVVVIPGDGIGPAITESVKSILKEAEADLKFIDRKLGKDASSKEIEEAMTDFERYGVMLKGPTETPIATEGKKSFNVTSRKGHGLFINFRRSQSFEPIIKTHFPAQDITVLEKMKKVFTRLLSTSLPLTLFKPLVSSRSRECIKSFELHSSMQMSTRRRSVACTRATF